MPLISTKRATVSHMSLNTKKTRTYIDGISSPGLVTGTTKWQDWNQLIGSQP